MLQKPGFWLNKWNIFSNYELEMQWIISFSKKIERDETISRWTNHLSFCSYTWTSSSASESLLLLCVCCVLWSLETRERNRVNSGAALQTRHESKSIDKTQISPEDIVMPTCNISSSATNNHIASLHWCFSNTSGLLKHPGMELK